MSSKLEYLENLQKKMKMWKSISNCIELNFRKVNNNWEWIDYNTPKGIIDDEEIKSLIDTFVNELEKLVDSRVESSIKEFNDADSSEK
jgi:hypothetical protein